MLSCRRWELSCRSWALILTLRCRKDARPLRGLGGRWLPRRRAAALSGSRGALCTFNDGAMIFFCATLCAARGGRRNVEDKRQVAPWWFADRRTSTARITRPSAAGTSTPSCETSRRRSRLDSSEQKHQPRNCATAAKCSSRVQGLLRPLRPARTARRPQRPLFASTRLFVRARQR